MSYPTEWMGGIRAGGKPQIIGNSYIARIAINGKKISKYFDFAKYEGKENAQKEAEKFLMETSAQNGLTRNMYRYLDKNKIEVKLPPDCDGDDHTFVTDSYNIAKVEMYKLCVKKKYDSNIKYVYYQNKKDSAKPFAELLCNGTQATYLDGNHFNLMISNLKSNKETNASPLVLNNDQYNIKLDQYEIAKLFNELSKIKNWTYIRLNLPDKFRLLGILPRRPFQKAEDIKKGIYTAVIVDHEGKDRSKTFNVVNYFSLEETLNEAIRWQYNESYKQGFTKNMITISHGEHGDYIIVTLTRNCITLLDIEFLPLIVNKLITLCVTKSDATSNIKVDIS